MVRALTLGCALILVLSTLGHLAPYYWAFELFDQFQLHALLAGALLLMAAVALRLKHIRLLALLVMMSSGVNVLPVLYAAAPRADSGYAKIINFNVLSTNPQQADVAQWLRAQNADVVALIEANARWNTTADSLRDLYPYQYRLDHAGNFGQMLFSRIPLENAQTIPAQSELEAEMIQADITLEGKRVRFILAHPTPPLLPAIRKMGRDSQIRHIAELVKKSPYPIVVLGDFNAAPWTHIMRELRDTANLTGFNVRASWPAALGPLGIPIDHIIAGNGAQIRFGGIGPKQGSDHRAVVGWLQ